MNGILLIDKPAGWTSMDVCARLRGVFGERRVGHSGTLDPMATGLLVVFLGRATRAVEFAEADEKTYEAAIRLGLTTDTQDITGTVLSSCEVDITEEQFDAALEKFRGDILQVPPMYSAIKVEGKPLYKVARKGGEVERQPRRVTVFSLERTGISEGDITFSIRCSKGTYIRTLCHDIGVSLGCGGAMSALRRTAAGPFSIENARTLDAVLAAAERGEAERLLLPVETLFSGARTLKLSPVQEKSVRNGAGFSSRLSEGQFLLYAQNGEFLALGRAVSGKMEIVKSFYSV